MAANHATTVILCIAQWFKPGGRKTSFRFIGRQQMRCSTQPGRAGGRKPACTTQVRNCARKSVRCEREIRRCRGWLAARRAGREDSRSPCDLRGPGFPKPGRRRWPTPPLRHDRLRLSTLRCVRDLESFTKCFKNDAVVLRPLAGAEGKRIVPLTPGALHGAVEFIGGDAGRVPLEHYDAWSTRSRWVLPEQSSEHARDISASKQKSIRVVGNHFRYCE